MRPRSIRLLPRQFYDGLALLATVRKDLQDEALVACLNDFHFDELFQHGEKTPLNAESFCGRSGEQSRTETSGTSLVVPALSNMKRLNDKAFDLRLSLRAKSQPEEIAP